MKEILHYAWIEIIRRPARSIGNMLGYSLALAIVIVLFSVLSFSQDASTAVLNSTGTHFITYLPQCNTEACAVDLKDPLHEGFIANNTPAKVISADIVSQITALDTVKDASAFILFRFYDEATAKYTLVAGFDPLNDTAVKTNCCAAGDIIQGEFLTPTDTGLVMLEESFALAENLPVGFRLDIGGQSFQVGGIINAGIRPGKADVYMPINELRTLINTRLNTALPSDATNIILVESAGANVHYQAINQVEEIMGDRSLVSTYACSKPASTAMGIGENGIWLISGILLISVIALALKSEYSAVLERRRDIGILKAIGLNNSTIVWQITAQSVIQALIGAGAGILLGIILIYAVPFASLSGIVSQDTLGIDWTVTLSAFGLAMAGGIIAGIIPALSAASMRPAESLRGL
ncbi:MAG: ABC transporter permease [Dehalococcoides mccartyi]|uniref:ABC transporter permease n=1 Tax=Dehalococcoides mccartyi TaxID=61435 RepID=UPI0025CB3E75|nr:ABC transporter permease [Dehalococcoides mccartyi]MDN4185619.1 ABC transporter permease [Dehalococcoides mccartyi]